MKYKVNSVRTPNGPIYIVEDTDGNRKPGSFDCERSAQAFADYLNEKERGRDVTGNKTHKHCKSK